MRKLVLTGFLIAFSARVRMRLPVWASFHRGIIRAIWVGRGLVVSKSKLSEKGAKSPHYAIVSTLGTVRSCLFPLFLAPDNRIFDHA